MAEELRTLEIGDGWVIDLPAACEAEREENNALVAWDDSRPIRVRTVTAVGGREDGSTILPEELANEESRDYRVERGDGVILELPPMHEETIEGEQVWTVPARAVAPNAVLLAYVHSRSPDDEEWARETAMSIRHSGVLT